MIVTDFCANVPYLWNSASLYIILRIIEHKSKTTNEIKMLIKTECVYLCQYSEHDEK